jgi:hypothetical protein
MCQRLEKSLLVQVSLIYRFIHSRINTYLGPNSDLISSTFEVTVRSLVITPPMMRVLNYHNISGNFGRPTAGSKLSIIQRENIRRTRPVSLTFLVFAPLSPNPRHQDLLKGIYDMGFSKPSKIQERALPLLLSNPFVTYHA